MRHVDTNPRDFPVSLAILTAVVLLALAGLAAEGNWPKVERVAASFAAYVAALFIARRTDGHTPDAGPYWSFALAGAVAGVSSGLLREEVRASTVAVGAIAAALILGGTHWIGLRFWRRLRSVLTT